MRPPHEILGNIYQIMFWVTFLICKIILTNSTYDITVSLTSGRHHYIWINKEIFFYLFLNRENITFIEPGMWPPNSPDLNPVDYAIWGALQQKAYLRRKFATIEQLKLVIVEEWQKLSQRFINLSIDQWRRRLEKTVENRGGHIEFDFWLYILIFHDNLLFSYKTKLANKMLFTISLGGLIFYAPPCIYNVEVINTYIDQIFHNMYFEH